MQHIHKYYNDKIKENVLLSEEIIRKIKWTGTIRLLIVLALIVTLIILRNQNWTIWFLTFILYMVPFVILIKYHSRLFIRREYIRQTIRVCEDELKALEYDFSSFEGASDRINPDHDYSFDLDLFGDNSFFQSINRTVSTGGRDLLVGWLEKPFSEKKDILRMQEAIKELSPLNDLRTHFLTTGKINRGNKNDLDLLYRLTQQSVCFSNRFLWKILIWLIPFLWLSMLAGYFWNIIPGIIPLLFFPFSALIANWKFRAINHLHQQTGEMDKILTVYSGLMNIIELKTFSSGILQEIGNLLNSREKPASLHIRKLSGLLGAMDNRANQLVILLNIFTLRDIRIALKIEAWKTNYGNDIEKWFSGLEKFDALISLSGFAYHHPEYIFPEIEDSYFTLTGDALGHPLLHRERCVKNDIRIEQHPYFMIVTGANMAGKSTYLRTIGINYILACIGAPVCAAKLKLSPAPLITSLRTSDSLIENESYFYAELRRLQRIIRRLEKGEKLFIILDEILKGTNSTDKQKGSFALIKQFLRMDSCGIIATHDLVLGQLEKEFPGQVKNYRFEADIREDQLSFSYLLQEGIAENLNAYFLMGKMGIF